jgi:hypothetical protein
MVYYYQDFDAETPGSVPLNWLGTGLLVSNLASYSPPNSAGITASHSGLNTSWTTERVTAYMMVPSVSDSSYFIVARTPYTGSSKPTSDYLTRIRTRNDGRFYVASGGNLTLNTGYPYTPGTFHKVEIEFDAVGSAFILWIDGNFVFGGSVYSLPYVNPACIYMQGLGGGLYIDNLQIGNPPSSSFVLKDVKITDAKVVQ